MLKRLAGVQVFRYLQEFPAVGLIGARQAGKTTLAQLVGDELTGHAQYLDLELPSDLRKLSDPELYFAAHEGQLLILDEIHRVPEIFRVLRGVIDQRRRRQMRTGQFLLLGSASIEFLRQSSESLAGRIAYAELTPFLVAEMQSQGFTDIERLWARGGFPDSFLARTNRTSFDWRMAFLRTYVERDLPDLGPRVPPETIFRFWRMLAHNQGQLLNASKLATSLSVSGQTIARYLDILVGLLLVRRLTPWTRNAAKRHTRSPKVYVRDSGLAHALLEIPNYEALLGHPVAGPSWEGFVIENLIATFAGAEGAWFYRTAAGAEIDLLLDMGAPGLWAFEIKRSLDPEPSRGFHNACDDLGARRRIIVYPGEDRYPLDRRTEVVGLRELVSTDFEVPRVRRPKPKARKAG